MSVDASRRSYDHRSSLSAKGRRLPSRGVPLLLILTLAALIGSETPPPRPADPPWIVTDVIDGDTLDVARGDELLTVRLIGLNAPERGECWADEATAALELLVGPGPVWLESDTSDVDQYGRALRFVENEAGDDVGAALVDEGHAIARAYPPDTSRDDVYALLQESARIGRRGLWAPDACGPAATSSVAIDVHPDAAGDDNVNLNDEWVRFTNTGDAALDLDGWTVKDESATHRYEFADLVLAPGASVTLFTGCGTDSATQRFWCKTDSAVWNNPGDTVFLLDAAGNVAATRGW